MENLNTQMDDQLKNRVAELNRANDENRDGRLDAADLKAQLNRIEAQLDSMMQDLPEITAQLKKVDVDALNKVLTELPALMDTVNSLQTQVQNISNWFSSLGSVFGR